MKKIFLFLLLLSPFCVTAQTKFKGHWYISRATDETHRILQIGDSTIFDVVYNQLGLTCRNVYRNDTLYLYVTDSDQGRGFMGPKFYPPDHGSLFAKCYLINNTLKIIYTQKIFRDNIKTLGLITTAYRLNK